MQAVFVQAIGYTGVLIFILSYQVKSNRRLFLLQVLGSLTFCVQFLLLNAYSGCFNLIIDIIRNLMLIKYNDWKWIRWRGWVVVISAISAVGMFLTWEGMVSLLLFIAMVGSTMAYWTNNAGKIRLGNLLCASPCWMLYDALVGSWGGVANELITLGSILFSIYRYGWKVLGDENSEFQK